MLECRVWGWHIFLYVWTGSFLANHPLSLLDQGGLEPAGTGPGNQCTGSGRRCSDSAEAGADCTACLPFCCFTSYSKTSLFQVPPWVSWACTAIPSHMELGLCCGGGCCSLAVWFSQLLKRVPKFRQLNSAVELTKLFTCQALAHCQVSC